MSCDPCGHYPKRRSDAVSAVGAHSPRAPLTATCFADECLLADHCTRRLHRQLACTPDTASYDIPTERRVQSLLRRKPPDFFDLCKPRIESRHLPTVPRAALRPLHGTHVASALTSATEPHAGGPNRTVRAARECYSEHRGRSWGRRRFLSTTYRRDGGASCGTAGAAG